MRQLAFLIFSLITFTAFGQGIIFETGTWEEALAKAQKVDKLIFVDAYAEWCGPCKVMAANVFTLSEAGSFYNSNFINVKMDMEKPEGRVFGKKYPVSAYPTLMFIDGEGNLVKKAVGGQKLEGLLALGTEALKSGGPALPNLEEKYTAGDRSYGFMMKYVTALSKNGKSTTKVINEYLEKNPTLSDSEKAMLLFEGTTDADSKIFDEMLKLKKTIIEMVSLTKYEEKIEQACRNTAKKAIEFELSSLLDESVNKAKQNLTINKGLENELKLEYYKAFKDENTYLTTAESFVKQMINNNPKEVRTMISEMCVTFNNSPSVKDKAVKFAQQLYKKHADIENLELYCITLARNGEKVKALKEIENSKKKVKNDEELLKKHDVVFNKVNAYQ
ncbi:MAG TPA: thioredoxin domain-containing protein [Saprospiraceae bacterium]|nr:thioredoxin domain-containing protein [Saprospiraceae bacterium]